MVGRGSPPPEEGGRARRSRTHTRPHLATTYTTGLLQHPFQSKGLLQGPGGIRQLGQVQRVLDFCKGRAVAWRRARLLPVAGRQTALQRSHLLHAGALQPGQRPAVRVRPVGLRVRRPQRAEARSISQARSGRGEGEGEGGGRRVRRGGWRGLNPRRARDWRQASAGGSDDGARPPPPPRSRSRSHPPPNPSLSFEAGAPAATPRRRPSTSLGSRRWPAT